VQAWLMVRSDPHPRPLPTRGRGVGLLSSPSPLWGGARGGGRVVPDHFARSLRNNATRAERVLWQQLRRLKSEGRHFRRQVPVAGYIADFVCHYPKLVVELDGSQHGEAVAYDEKRSGRMREHGYKVLRFWNSEVFDALESVLDRIRFEVRLPAAFRHGGATPTPNPSPQGGAEPN
jgi:very-short-patch-repair endonuclease